MMIACGGIVVKPDNNTLPGGPTGVVPYPPGWRSHGDRAPSRSGWAAEPVAPESTRIEGTPRQSSAPRSEWTPTW